MTYMVFSLLLVYHLFRLSADYRDSQLILLLFFAQNDAAAPGSLAGRHQLLRPGALPLAARHAHPGRLRHLHPLREGGAACGHPDQAPAQRPARRDQLRRGQLQLRPGLRGPGRGGRRQERGEERGETGEGGDGGFRAAARGGFETLTFCSLVFRSRLRSWRGGRGGERGTRSPPPSAATRRRRRRRLCSR